MVGLFVLGTIGGLAAQVRDVAVWFGAATFFAVALSPLVSRLEPRIGRTAAVLTVFFGFVLGLLLIVAALIVPFVSQVHQLSNDLPAAIQTATSHGWPADLNRRFHLVQHAKAHADALPAYAFGAIGTILSGVLATVTTLFLTAFLLFELPAIGNLILSQLPPQRRPRARRIGAHINHNVGGYVAGNLIISLICGAATLAAMFSLGVPYSLAFAVFMAVFDIIPLIGATVGAVLVISATLLLTGTEQAIIMLIFVIIYQQIENHVLQPIIYRRTVAVAPLVVLVAVLCGAAVLGLIGALVAVPVAATLQTIAKELLDERAIEN